MNSALPAPLACSRCGTVSEADAGGKMEIIKVNTLHEAVTLYVTDTHHPACGLGGSGVKSQQYFSSHTSNRAHLPDLPHSAAAPRSIISIFCAGRGGMKASNPNERVKRALNPLEFIHVSIESEPVMQNMSRLVAN